MACPNLQRIAADQARVNDASTLKELGTLYEEIVGYDVTEDDPAATVESVRALLTGFLDEEARSYERG